MARFQRPSTDRTIKFSDKLRNKKDFNLVSPRGSDGSLRALAKFLSSFGPKVTRLSKSSRTTLINQNAKQDQLMRESAIDSIQDNSKKQIKNVLERYAQNKISHKALSAELKGIVKRQALASAIIGVRGVGNLTDNVITAVKRQLSVQLAYLDGFLKDIEGRTLTSRDKARAAQYANASWAMSQTAARQFNLDNTGSATQLEERRRLGGSEHCDDCVEMADEWQPFGTLPVPGQGSVCGSNCRCTIEYRSADDTQKQTSENPVKEG